MTKMTKGCVGSNYKFACLSTGIFLNRAFQKNKFSYIKNKKTSKIDFNYIDDKKSLFASYEWFEKEHSISVVVENNFVPRIF